VRRLWHGRPLWVDHLAAPKRTYPRHRGGLDTDVVIVGGGITGAICAYLFSEAGIRVVLLEAATAGSGSTVASTALLMQEPDRDFSDLAARFGYRATREIWVALARATRELAKLVVKLELDAGLCACQSVYFTVDTAKVRGLRREFELRKRAGLAGRWLSSSALERLTGIKGEAAIATPGNAQVNPLRACDGFLRAAARLGARIFERSQVRRVSASRERVEVHTSGGVIRADRVIVATGYVTPEFRGLVGRFRMKDTYVIATRRLPARLRPAARQSAKGRRQLRATLPMAWDTDRPYHYLRWADDGRLLVGGADTNHRLVKGSRRRIARARARLTEYLARVYPALTGERPEYAWEGLFAETPDGLPYIGSHSRYPRHLFALGYGGNGMTGCFLAARLLLDLYQARDNRRKSRPDANLFAFRRVRR
jgi:glycine/D-amino acid oxidase-like deaminating enzyme